MAKKLTPPLTEIYVLMRLAREWDLRFENLFRTGAVTKWYSSVGNEALTVACGLALERGDGLCTLHRDVGAILAHYLDLSGLFPQLSLRSGTDRRGDPRQLLHRLACQMMGKADGFTGGYDRSYHFGYLDARSGIVHVGMISHLGAMIPVAAGLALAARREGNRRVALNFSGEGGAWTGDLPDATNSAP